MFVFYKLIQLNDGVFRKTYRLYGPSPIEHYRVGEPIYYDDGRLIRPRKFCSIITP